MPKLCADLGVTQSMGAVGSSADNALAESFNATLKQEVLQDAATWPDETTCRRQVFKWLTATTPTAGTPTAGTSPRSPTKPPPPLRSRQRRNPTPCPRNGGKARPHRGLALSPSNSESTTTASGRWVTAQ
jgi:transposase InsO family protein